MACGPLILYDSETRY